MKNKNQARRQAGTKKLTVQVQSPFGKAFDLTDADGIGTCAVVYNRETKRPEIKIPFTETEWYNLFELRLTQPAFRDLTRIKIIALAVRDWLKENKLNSPEPDEFSLPGAGTSALCLCQFDCTSQNPFGKVPLTEHEVSDMLTACKRSEYFGLNLGDIIRDAVREYLPVKALDLPIPPIGHSPAALPAQPAPTTEAVKTFPGLDLETAVTQACGLMKMLGDMLDYHSTNGREFGGPEVEHMVCGICSVIDDTTEKLETASDAARLAINAQPQPVAA